jgi:tRNA (guanine-N7-)-methyltransferase
MSIFTVAFIVYYIPSLKLVYLTDQVDSTSEFNRVMQKLSSLTLPWPTNWGAEFGTERRLILEIGFGYGAFLTHLARQNPDANVVGVEVASKCLTAAENAVERQKLTNVRIIHSTAETTLHHLFQPNTLNQVHINFPDPWFKKKHGHRRLMQRDTLDAIVNRLQPGGLLYLATDIIEYAEMSAELLAETPGLDNRLDTSWVLAMPGRVVTKYEGRATRAGRDCYYFAYQRNTTVAPIVPVIEELDMPHIVFKSQLTLDEMLAEFGSSEHNIGDTHINILNGYRGKSVLLFEVYVKEPTIDQRVALVLSERPDEHEYTLKLGVIGHPRPTFGLHKATGILGDWLIGLHPDTEVLKRKIRE